MIGRYEKRKRREFNPEEKGESHFYQAGTAY